MTYLRAWRETLGLSRQNVVDRMGELTPGASPVDQATLEKWEAGKSAVRVEDIKLLAEVYGVTVDRLFFSPLDKRTPAQIHRAVEIITASDPDLIDDWLNLGKGLRSRPESGT